MKHPFSLILFVLLGYLFAPPQLKAQDKPDKITRKSEKKARKKARKAATQHYLQLGATGNLIHFSDANISSQLYGGLGGGGIAAWHTYAPKVYTRGHAWGLYNPVDALTAGPGGEVFGGGGGYIHAFKLKPWWNGRIQPYLGPALSGFYRVRFINLGNSSFNEDLVFNIGAAGHLRSDFKLFKKPAFATYTLKVPVFSYLLSEPLYGVSLSGDFERYAPLGAFNQVISEITLARQIGQTGNFLQIGYSWDYYAFSKESNPLRLAQHGLTLALMIRL